MKYYKRTMHQGAQPSTFRIAALLRKNPTKAEEILWERLRNNQIEGVHFRRQHPFNRYIPDFYANEVKLVIELDGSIHEEKSIQFSDADRELNLKMHSLYIIRYSNEDVYKSENEVVEDIRLTVIQLMELKKQRKKKLQ
jgi:very-short-patch-repair endonuclease